MGGGEHCKDQACWWTEECVSSLYCSETQTHTHTAHLIHKPIKLYYLIDCPDIILFCHFAIKLLNVWKLKPSTHQILVTSKSASLKHEIHDFWETKWKKIQHSENDKQGKENPNTPAIFAKALKKAKQPNQYWPTGHKNTTRSHTMCNNGPLKSMFDIICRIFTIHIHRGHLRHLILQYHLFAYNRGYDAQLQSKA